MTSDATSTGHESVTRCMGPEHVRLLHMYVPLHVQEEYETFAWRGDCTNPGSS